MSQMVCAVAADSYAPAEQATKKGGDCLSRCGTCDCDSSGNFSVCSLLEPLRSEIFVEKCKRVLLDAARQYL